VRHRHSSTSGPYSESKIYLVERNRFWLAVKSFPLPLLLAGLFLTLNAGCGTWLLLSFVGDRLGTSGERSLSGPSRA
jgi:hypothetical protein